LRDRGAAWLRAAPAVALGIALACVTAFAFVPSVMALYETRGSPPVSVDSASLSLVALVANLAVLALIVAAGRRAPGRRDE
jgi:protein-S-isoprenylcysteine O-methyltransferase Ste14